MYIYTRPFHYIQGLLQYIQGLDTCNWFSLSRCLGHWASKTGIGFACFDTMCQQQQISFLSLAFDVVNTLCSAALPSVQSTTPPFWQFRPTLWLINDVGMCEYEKSMPQKKYVWTHFFWQHILYNRWCLTPSCFESSITQWLHLAWPINDYPRAWRPLKRAKKIIFNNNRVPDRTSNRKDVCTNCK